MNFTNTTSVSRFDNLINTGTDRIKEITNDAVCYISNNYVELFWYFLIPVAICIIGFIIMMHKRKISNWIESKYIQKGYVKVYMLSNSKRLTKKIKKLDKYSKFKLGKKAYSLDDMENFIFAYDKKNVPIFLYHTDFILPFTVQTQKLTDEIKNEFELDDENKEEISAIKMRISSSILGMIYDKKLLSDLYDTTVSDNFKERMVYIVLAVLGLVIAYYTGILDRILEFF